MLLSKTLPSQTLSSPLSVVVLLGIDCLISGFKLLTQKEDSFLPWGHDGEKMMITDTSALKSSLFFLPHLHVEICIGDMHMFSMVYFLWLLASQLLSLIRGMWAPLCLLPTDSGIFLWHCSWPPRLPCPGVLGMAQQPQLVGSHRCGWFVFVCFFSFFICLDSCSRNSAGVWCQQRISTLAQRPAALRKHVLVGLITLSAWISVFLETSPKGKTLPNQWVRVSSSQEMSVKSLLIGT